MKKKKQTITTPSLSRQGMIKSLLCVLVALMLWPATSWAQEYVATVYYDATFTTEKASYTSLNQALMNAEDGEGVRLIHNVQEKTSYTQSQAVQTLLLT